MAPKGCDKCHKEQNIQKRKYTKNKYIANILHSSAEEVPSGRRGVFPSGRFCYQGHHPVWIITTIPAEMDTLHWTDNTALTGLPMGRLSFSNIAHQAICHKLFVTRACWGTALYTTLHCTAQVHGGLQQQTHSIPKLRSLSTLQE